MRAWDVDWGAGSSRIIVENGYLDVKDAVVRKGRGELRAAGRFSLGYPRKDKGEELNARITATDWSLADLRHAFAMDAYPIDGNLSGEFHLYGPYTGPLRVRPCHRRARGRLRRAPGQRLGLAAVRRHRRLVRRPGDPQGHRRHPRRGARRVGGHLLVQRRRPRHPCRVHRRPRLPAAAADGALRVLGRRQRRVHVPDVRRRCPIPRPVRQGRRHRRRERARSPCAATT